MIHRLEHQQEVPTGLNISRAVSPVSHPVAKPNFGISPLLDLTSQSSSTSSRPLPPPQSYFYQYTTPPQLHRLPPESDRAVGRQRKICVKTKPLKSIGRGLDRDQRHQ